jgi:oxygen-independent coproporphyrinogen-3 oxidase
MSADKLALRYGAPVPRYTSYPTAPHFTGRVGVAETRAWLGALRDGARLSLYVHIPFCQTLCWYCGCNTKVVNKYEPIERYLGVLEKELTSVSKLVPKDHSVGHIHLGGGSPNILKPAHIGALAAAMRERFHIDADAEFAVEIDPRGLDGEHVAAMKAAGVNRVSIGVQDFDAAVQAAINREQSYETTRQAVSMLRDAGIGSINIDLVYGLPHQTRQSVARTMEQVLSLEPDRIAIFGYAHLPERIRHQRLIDTAALPDLTDRLGQANRLARILAAKGYVRIGLDHFAKPTDPLAREVVHRNFQGYTTDGAEALIGFGASAISRFDDGYTQNAVAITDYQQRIEACSLATSRGVALSQDDRVRAFVIERLMCDLSFSQSSLRERFGDAAGPVIADAETLIDTDADGLVERTSDGFRVSEHGRPFVRSICACFDAYLGAGEARHALGV